MYVSGFAHIEPPLDEILARVKEEHSILRLLTQGESFKA